MELRGPFMEIRIRGHATSSVKEYDILGADGRACFTSVGRLPGQNLVVGKQVHVYDLSGQEVIYVRSLEGHIFGKVEIAIWGEKKGYLSEKFFLITPRFNTDFFGYRVKASFMGSRFTIYKGEKEVASLKPALASLAGDLTLSFSDESEEINLLALAIAIDCVHN